MPKKEEVKDTKTPRAVKAPDEEIVPILLNRTRGRIMVPKPRVGRSGSPKNPQKFACDIVNIHPGINRPTDLATWKVVRDSRRTALKMEGDEPELRQLGSMSEIPDMSVEMVLANCSDRASVEWWLSVEKRHRVREKIQAWLTKLDERIEKRFGKRPVQAPAQVTA